MSKPRAATEKAFAYERQVVESKQKSYKHLSDQAIKYEHKLLNQKIKGQVAIRDSSLIYERKITDAQFATLKALSDEHRIFHEREHLLYEDAIEKAADTLKLQHERLVDDFNRERDKSVSHMTVDQFDREHKALTERIDAKFNTYDEKLIREETVTARQETQAETLRRVTNDNRWFITTILAIGALAAKLLGLF